MKKLIAALSIVPVFAMAHPGHGTGFHILIHPGWVGLAVIAGFILVLRTFTRNSARTR